MVYGGRISEEKGVEELIKTFLRCNFKNIYLKIIGNGPALRYLQKEYEGEFIEFVDEISNKEMLEIICNAKGL